MSERETQVDTYQSESLTPEIFAELAPLMMDAFGDSVDSRYFDWKYQENPAGAATGRIARADNGEIAAFYGMIPEVVRFGGKPHRIYQSCDTMTHTRHRRRGLFQRLAKETFAEARAADPNFFAYGFGGPTSTPGFLKMGWRIDAEVPNRFRPFPLTLLPVFGANPGKVQQLEAPDETLIASIAEADDQRDGRVERSEAFVRWRLRNPLRRYSCLVERGVAHAIFYAIPGSVFLFDLWEASPGAGKNVWDALRRTTLSPRGKGLISFAQPGSPFAEMLSRYGFLRNPFGRGPASGGLPLISFGDHPPGAPAAWAVSPFDHDSY